MEVFKTISTATASRDLQQGVELGLIRKTGTGNKTKYKRTTGHNIDYYFDARNLYFAFGQSLSYNRPIYYDEKPAREMGDTESFIENMTSVTGNRYYFNDGQLILWLDSDKKEVDINQVKSRDKGEEIISHATELKEKFEK